MSLSISGELCRCSASRFWGLTGEPKSDTCIFKIKQFFAAGTSCVFVFVFTFYKQWPVWFPCCRFLSWSRQFFPPFLSGTRLSTAINRPTLTRPGMDRRENGIFSPVHAPQSPFLSGISMGLIDFQFDLFLLPPKTGKSTFADKSVWEPPVKSFMSTCARENDSSSSQGTQRQFSENICSEDDLRSRIFGTFVVKFLACLPLLGFSNI